MELLQFCDGFTAVFGVTHPGSVNANFTQAGSLQQLLSKDGQTVLNCKQVPKSSKCTFCKDEVLSNNSPQGQGLECNNCEGWFHNQCHSSPVSHKLYGLLATSPHFLKAICPSCLGFNQGNQQMLLAEIHSLKTEFSGFKKAFASEMAEIKSTLKLEQLKEHINNVLDKEAMEAYCSDIHHEVTNITTSTNEMKANLENTLLSVDNVADQMAQSVQRMDKLDITGLSKEVVDLSANIDHALEKLELVNRTNSPNLNTPNNKISSTHMSAINLVEYPSLECTFPPSTGASFSTSSYSNAVKKQLPKQVHQAQSNTSQPPTKQLQKFLCDESKTIAIENILNYSKFIKLTKDTKKEFNKYHPGVKIVHSKGTRRGTLLIELQTEEEAKAIVKQWNSECFSDNAEGTVNKTHATLLKDKNCKGIMYDIDHEHSEDFIANEVKKSNLKMDVTIRRFMKGSKKMSTVMITFGCKEDLDQALKYGVKVGNSPEDVHLYKPTPKVVQCFKCFKFDHTKVWCSKKKKSCRFCTQPHEDEECLIHKENDVSQFKCVNCNTNGHDSLSKECPTYKDKLAQTINYSEL